ncbi:MAG TPA: molybdate ABC transporter substrate-binding protein [Gammaproteobacteria bacterium]|nr:molybdate ABC transporter substrate-binding protein [Gammaproteobacteria bacterium]
MKRPGLIHLLTRGFLGLFVYVYLLPVQAAQPLVVAAASDLRYAMNRLVSQYRILHPQDILHMVYGSSGKFRAQIANGAPFDLFFSADISYPEMLQKQGLTASKVYPYALGRIALWSATRAADRLKLRDLVAEDIKKIAIANPLHAPYGQRAKEALQQVGIWEKVKPKLVYGENISHTAQLVASGAADIGIIALSLAVSPELRQLGGYSLIPERLHKPLLQGFVITRHGGDRPEAKRFAAFIRSAAGHKTLASYGFSLPAVK